jgi:hypothetical protein
MTKNPCLNCEPLFSDFQLLHHKKVLKYQRDWFVLKIENNELKDQIKDLKELLRLHNQAKIELAVIQ